MVLLCAFALQAQVGINNTDPKAQLDISAGITPSEIDGLLIPRLDEFPIGVNTDQDGMLVFMTGNGAPTKGFFYWDHTGTAWVAVTGSGGGTLDEAYDFGGAGAGNIITATDGALTINGQDGLLVTGTYGSGDAISVSGNGARMFFNPRKAAFRAGRAIGTNWDNNNVGDFSVGFGSQSIASGFESFAFGRISEASGTTAIAMGLETLASGDYSTAFGENTTTSGSHSTAFGWYNTTPSFGEMAVGVVGTNYTAMAPSGFNVNDRIFSIGNGIRTGAGTLIRSNALTIYKSGLMNINDEYNMPLTDGAAGQVMTSDGTGNISFQTPSDNQQIDVLNLNGTNLEISLQDDGVATQILDLSTLQDGSGGTLDQAYDFGGAGAGNIITATDGALTVSGEDGILVTGTIGSGATITTSGAGTRMFFNPRKAAFRAGNVTAIQWDDANVGIGSTAIGESLIAAGDYATAFGRANIASGLYATAFGVQTQATAENATAFGIQTTASGNTATAFGSQTTASALYSTAFGRNTTASGTASAAFGEFTTASGNYATSLGYATISPSSTEISMGFYNSDYTPTGTNTDRAFSIGNGISNTNRSNAFSVYKNGLININDEYNMPLTDGTVGQVMTSDGAGNVSWVDDSTNANNGLTLNTSNVQLGGPLIQNTIITQGTRSLDINLNSSGDFAIQDNGADVFFVEDTGDIGIGTGNPSHPLHILENTASEIEGVFVDKNDNSTAETNGIYVEKSGTGTGRSHAIRTRNDGTGTGQKYGVFNTITATSAGTQYGVRNFLNATTTAWQFGTFNNLDNAATGNQYGVYNGMRGANAANIYGVYNEFERAYSSPDDIVGVRNRFTGGTPGTNGMNGVWTDFTTAAAGNYYGTRTEYQNGATGTGNKYGTYNQISASAGGTHYGTYNSVSATDGWAGYFLGKNYISERLSIGETDNANGKLSILNNSGGANPSHIQLTEIGANDGPRIEFANATETTNEWTLFGRADNTLADSQFNIFHTGTGNVLQVKGDGNVGITGDPDTDFHVFHGNSGSTSGMKLQNTTDNTWWRFYVSSGSDDLRLFNSNNGATVMGAFNDATGAYTATSDRRLKKDFKDLYFSWDNFMAMKPLTYKYKQDNKPTTYIGMVAQDVEKVYPELVTYHEDNDVYHMDYSATGIVAIKGVQELKKELIILASENKKLKKQLAKYESLEARLTALENGTGADDIEAIVSEEKK